MEDEIFSEEETAETTVFDDETASVEDGADQDAGDGKEANEVDFDAAKDYLNQDSDAEKKKIDEQKQKQDAEKNAEFARKRREAEKEAAIAEAKESARVQAVIDFVGKNPYTGKEIKDAVDVKVYETMKAYEAEGKDPLDCAEEIYRKVFAADKKTEKKDDKSDSAKFEVEGFLEKFPDAKIESVLSDPKFNIFCKGRTGKLPLAELYADYIQVTGGETQKDADVKKKTTPSVGSLRGQASPKTKYLTREQIDNMTPEQRRKNVELIQQSLWHMKK